MLPEEKTKALLEKRMRGLVKAWGRLLLKPDLVDGRAFALNSSIASKVVRHYAKDLDILKRRYGIPNLVQAPKISGLMASAILKYRPLVPIKGKQDNVGLSEANEVLAIYHGICICANYDTDSGINALDALANKPIFSDWLDRFIYLLRERNYTSESLIMIFETLCMAAFPDSMLCEASV